MFVGLVVGARPRDEVGAGRVGAADDERALGRLAGRGHDAVLPQVGGDPLAARAARPATAAAAGRELRGRLERGRRVRRPAGWSSATAAASGAGARAGARCAA